MSKWHLLSLYPRMLRIPLLARLRARECPAFEFAFGLEPIVQITAWLFAAFEIDLVCATSDVLVTLPVLTEASPASAAWAEIACGSAFPSNGTYAATAGKFIRAHAENLVGCWPAIWFASSIRSCESEPR